MPEQNDPNTALLEALETVVIPATSMPVVIRDFFLKNSRVKFAAIWSEFKTRFFDKTENPIPEVTYRKYKLLRISPDGPIIAQLGGEAKVEGTVTAALALLQRQGHGGAGFLQTNGYANIFYIKDKDDVLCAIRIGWADDGWVIDAIAVQDPLAWNGKHEIFCPI
ncbi:MAG TPA: hypothetical protein VMR33_14265 [Candidatus Baltobacteraceae bacterium]|jgi:hypothetical protein|nr:hypothetical protein [Candidatus Baltobacteraceae bacterium]